MNESLILINALLVCAARGSVRKDRQRPPLSGRRIARTAQWMWMHRTLPYRGRRLRQTSAQQNEENTRRDIINSETRFSWHRFKVRKRDQECKFWAEDEN